MKGLGTNDLIPIFRWRCLLNCIISWASYSIRCSQCCFNILQLDVTCPYNIPYSWAGLFFLSLNTNASTNWNIKPNPELLLCSIYAPLQCLFTQLLLKSGDDTNAAPIVVLMVGDILPWNNKLFKYTYLKGTHYGIFVKVPVLGKLHNLFVKIGLNGSEPMVNPGIFCSWEKWFKCICI